MNTIVITGANRGIGLELCRQYRQHGHRVIAVCRARSNELDALDVEVIDGIDVTRPDDVARLGGALDKTPIDILINNAAILRSDTFPALDVDGIRDHLEANTLGPLRVSLTLLDRLRPGSKLIFITSRVGSLADNTSGGNYGYRISKTALNMAGLNLSKDLQPLGIPVALLHPGYVRTGMTRFNGHIDSPEAATGLIQRIEELTLEDTGCFRHANGEDLPW